MSNTSAGSRVVRPLLVAVVLLAGGGAACSDDGDDGAPAAAASTTGSTLSFEENDAVVRLNLAATGMNLVAGDVGLRTTQGSGAEYCRSSAPAELAPHRSDLEAAADAGVREAAATALEELRTAIELCAGDAGSDAVHAALERYNAAFTGLQRRIDAAAGG